MTSGAIEQALNQALEQHRDGRLAEAESIYRQVLAAQPNHPEALHGMGLLADQVGQHKIAAELINRAIAADSTRAEWYANLAAVFVALGLYDRAIVACRAGLQRDPNCFDAHHNLGYAHQQIGQIEAAITAYRQAIRLKPDFPDAYNHLGNVLLLSGDFDQALEAYHSALRYRPDFPDVFNNLGSLHKWRGQLGEAMEYYRRAIALRPAWPLAHSNLVYTMHFCPQFSAAEIFQAHRRWNELHAMPLSRSIQPHVNDRDPDRRLRVGYVSPDFREHPVGRFLLPLFERHNRQEFEVVCFSDVRRCDAFTARLRALVSEWHDVVGLTDDQLAQFVRQQRIDLLVDLAAHLDLNRLLVFARKPAPVQVTYLGYCSTTGLDAMDYRLSDPNLDPPSMDEAVYSETTVRLPQTYWCYQPSLPMPAPGPLPAHRAGHVTFGCLNNFSKVTPAALRTWCRILRAVPESRLLLHTPVGEHRRGLIDLFVGESIEPERVSFTPFVPFSEFGALCQGIDVGLDPFPYNGGTTTCDTLWMGIPVVTLAGNTAVARAGSTLLTSVGLPELVARSEQQYVTLAVELASDLPRLAELRSSLRERMQASPLMDAPQFARDVEQAYRNMWRRWCRRPTP